MDNYIKENTENKIESRESYKIIYVLQANSEIHKGTLKIGETTIKISDGQKDNLSDNSDLMIKATRKRADTYLGTSGLIYDVLYTTIAKDKDNQTFKDKKVHKVLERSNIEKINLNDIADEWFRCDLKTAISAINAVKDLRKSLNGNEITTNQTPIILRKEQKEAIENTIKTLLIKKVLKKMKMCYFCGIVKCALEKLLVL